MYLYTILLRASTVRRYMLRAGESECRAANIGATPGERRWRLAQNPSMRYAEAPAFGRPSFRTPLYRAAQNNALFLALINVLFSPLINVLFSPLINVINGVCPKLMPYFRP